MEHRFRHLGLARWPFPVVPDPEFCNFMADREQLKSDIANLLRILSRRDASSIHLFWAWFGAGKTHSLYYIASRAASENNDHKNNGLHTVYSEFPRAARGFVDLYRSFAEGLSGDLLADSYLEISTCSESKSFQQTLIQSSPDLSNALIQIAMGDSSQQMTALRWLRAENLPLSQIRAVGISKRIDTVEDAVRNAAALMRLISLADKARGKPGSMVLWMIDEFQRIARCSSRTAQEINVALHSLFNATPNGLALFISFSGTPEKSLPDWFSRELRDRLARAKTMLLPPLSFDEGLAFVREVLRMCRIPDVSVDELFPFTGASAQAILKELAKHGQIKPRAIMQAFGAVLEEADPLIESGKVDRIDAKFATEVLADRISFTDEENE